MKGNSCVWVFFLRTCFIPCQTVEIIPGYYMNTLPLFITWGRSFPVINLRVGPRPKKKKKKKKGWMNLGKKKKKKNSAHLTSVNCPEGCVRFLDLLKSRKSQQDQVYNGAETHAKKRREGRNQTRIKAFTIAHTVCTLEKWAFSTHAIRMLLDGDWPLSDMLTDFISRSYIVKSTSVRLPRRKPNPTLNLPSRVVSASAVAQRALVGQLLKWEGCANNGSDVRGH